MSFGKAKQASSSVCLGKRTSSAGSPGSTAVRAGLIETAVRNELGHKTQGGSVREKKLGARQDPEAVESSRGMMTERCLSIYNRCSNYKGLKMQFYLMTKY